MDREAIKIAIESLAIADIVPRDLRVTIDDDYEPKYANGSLNAQWKYFTRKIGRMEIGDPADDSGQQPIRLLRFIVETGVRFVDETARNEESGEPKVCAQIEATFCAEYNMTKEVDEVATREFANHNAVFHVWPYWRELVQSECARFRLPILVLPMFKIGDGKNQEHAIVEAGSENE